MKKIYLIGTLLILALLVLSSFPSLALILGDFNEDGCVQFEDLMIFALAYGSTSSDDNWNPACDIASASGVLEPDGIINFEDLMVFAMGYGECEEVNWTVMVYMDGDNNLEYSAWDDLGEMELVGSTNKVNIVTQVDLYNSCSGTYRYLITGVEQGTSYPLYLDDIVQELSEQNMADPTVLNDFISWSMNNYPADKYLLVLWNHGGGWREVERNIAERGIIVDDTSDDYLTMAELVTGLEGIPDNIDILGFDACLMQMIEVYYELGMNINNPPAPCYGIGSQANEWADGWPYDAILADMVSNPLMTEAILCQTIVDNYINDCGSIGTLSALDFCSEVTSSEYKDTMNAFANALMNSEYQNEINLIRSSNLLQTYNSDDYKDLYHFAEIIYDNVPDCQSEAQAVMNIVDDVVFANQYTGIGLDNSNGLSIYLPDSPDLYDNAYDLLQFATDTQWDEFLQYVPPVHNITKDIYYNTIQAALDEAEGEDTIEVADGTFSESILFPCDKKISLQSINGYDSTIIRGNNNRSTVIFDGSLEGTVLEGFTITHESENEGHGISVAQSNLSINNCRITGNFTSSSFCFGILLDSGNLAVVNSIVSSNFGSEACVGIFVNNGDIAIQGSQISNNSADLGGVGIYFDFPVTEIYSITGNTICGNYTVDNEPVLGQQIGDAYGSLYDTYKSTNNISAFCGE